MYVFYCNFSVFGSSFKSKFRDINYLVKQNIHLGFRSAFLIVL